MISNTRIALVGALVGAAQATNWANTTGIHYTTEIVTELTTYCPAPTTLTHGDKTYTVTEPTTLTITDCPCTLTKPVEPTSTAEHPEPTGPPKDECAEKCTKAYDECRVAPDANMATCAAQYAECLNFNPFDGDNTTVTACSAEPHYTTEVVTHLTTYCPEPTTLTFDHSTYTVTEATTLTISDCSCTISKPVETHPVPTKPVETHPVPTKPAGDCPTECTTAYNKCRIAPGSNKSSCAAQYAGCLGYNPFAGNGTMITPTACSYGPKPTATEPPKGEPTPEHPGTPDQPGTPEHPGTPDQPETPEHPGTPEQPPAADCPEECTAAYRKCQSGPDANQSYCASQIASCLGYNPFESGSFVEPTACSAQPPKTTLQPTPSATTPATPGGSESPDTPGSPSSVPTAAADHLSPLKALGVIAAIALL